MIPRSALHYLSPVVAFSAILSATLVFAQDTSPNTIYIHGNVLTGAHLQPSDSSATPDRVSAIAVTNSTIIAVGSDEELLKLKGPRTQVVDLGGAFVMPVRTSPKPAARNSP